MQTQQQRLEALKKRLQSDKNKETINKLSVVNFRKKAMLRTDKPKTGLSVLSFFITIVPTIFFFDLFIGLISGIMISTITFVIVNKHTLFKQEEIKPVEIPKKDFLNMIERHGHVLNQELMRILLDIDEKLKYLIKSKYTYILTLDEMHLIRQIEEKHIKDILEKLLDCNKDYLSHAQLEAFHQITNFDKKLTEFIQQEVKEIERNIKIKSVHVK